MLGFSLRPLLLGSPFVTDLKPCEMRCVEWKKRYALPLQPSPREIDAALCVCVLEVGGVRLGHKKKKRAWQKRQEPRTVSV